jgi:hypothetical protein
MINKNQNELRSSRIQQVPKINHSVNASELKGYPPTAILSATVGCVAINFNKVSPVAFAKYLSSHVSEGVVK